MDKWDKSLYKYRKEVMEDMGLNKEEMAEMIMGIYESKNKDWMYASDEDDIAVADDQWWEEEEIEEASTEYAVILMDELTANNLDSHVLLKYPEIANWWGSVLKERNKKAEAKRKKEEARIKKEEDARARDLLLSRLTPEEKRLLGVK